MNIDEANALYYKGPSDARDAQGKLADNFDDFLLMLTTQLQNQDPLNPTDSNEFTNQLVNFTQVEQSIATNENLEALINLQSINQQNSQATILIDYLGKTVEANANIGNMENGEVTWNMDFSVAADNVSYDIYNESGAKVDTITVDGTVSAGETSFTWDGQLSTGGGQAPDGLYFLVPNATTDGGSTVDVGFNIKGTAQRVETIGGVPMLFVNNMPISINNITSVAVGDTTDNAA
ncbi:hypothetical protein GUA87_17130 [Sneathiella sp. P13V-1]|uniref:flagellar hook assembly protein FlgD n=1 Tax=Sneathiella sp. P13V-1 TaxID=2697366 RepID=UPI00187B1671|nr:flagellar hook capping FlgD N-terminal domain-containing protein [Sneathiella sp. P13V-1]MBE7638583.1 hypothetical protein [Sneathiella sp. P13V-1]